jgi:2-hydroxy-6-oxonona-2,4-dienedioate hydrolase
VRVHAVRSEAPGSPRAVLVHGLGVSTRHLLPAVRAFAAVYEVWAPDLPGFGRSGRPPTALTVAGLAAALARWLEAVGVPGRSLVLGNSLGCQVAVELASARPQAVERLALVGPTVDPAARSLARQLARLLVDSTREPPALDLVVAMDYLRSGPVRTLTTARHMLAHRLEERLPLVAAPALVVRGARDPIAPQRWAERAAALLPDGRLAVVPGAAHAAHFSHPRELLELVLMDAARPRSSRPPSSGNRGRPRAPRRAAGRA